MLRNTKGVFVQLHENGLLCPKTEFLRQDHFVRHRWRSLRVFYRWAGRWLIFVFEAMFDGGRMIREVGPGHRPLERHEFEKNYHDVQGRNF